MTRKTLLLIACLMGYAAAVFSQTLNRSAWMKGLSDEIPVCQLTTMKAEPSKPNIT